MRSLAFARFAFHRHQISIRSLRAWCLILSSIFGANSQSVHSCFACLWPVCCGRWWVQFVQLIQLAHQNSPLPGRHTDRSTWMETCFIWMGSIGNSFSDSTLARYNYHGATNFPVTVLAMLIVLSVHIVHTVRSIPDHLDFSYSRR